MVKIHRVCFYVNKKIKLIEWIEGCIYSFFLVCAALLLPFVFSKSQKTQDVLEKLELLDEMVRELEDAPCPLSMDGKKSILMPFPNKCLSLFFSIKAIATAMSLPLSVENTAANGPAWR